VSVVSYCLMGNFRIYLHVFETYYVLFTAVKHVRYVYPVT